MTDLESLESKLNNLRLKWKGKVPKSSADLGWWDFRCDSCIATSLKRQIEEAKK